MIHPPLPVIHLRDYAILGVLTVNETRTAESGALPDDPAKWTPADVRFALDSGLACITKAHLQRKRL